MLGLRRLRHNRRTDFERWPFVSVIMPARNEADVLERTLQSLLAQDYPGQWEIIVVDDRSTDHTPQVLRRVALESDRLRPIRVTEENPRSPKKHALALGIKHSQGEIIATTDADCVYDPAWIRSMVSHMAPEVGVVAGLTVFDLPENRVPAWQKIQWLDFFAQNSLAAGAAGAGVPSSCNGSNLFYRREVYDTVSGFGTSASIVSGDDVLFTQRVAKNTPWKIIYAAVPEATVRSLPVLSVRELFQQRLRWASKGLTYKPSMLMFLFGIYAYYMLLGAVPFVLLAKQVIIWPLVCVLAWKLAWDYATVRIGCRVFQQDRLRPYFLPYSIIQLYLYPFFGLAGLMLPFRWKGDWYRTPRLPRRLRRGILRFRRLMRSRRPATSSSR
jgi:cellulose synthase/poly-beta-1,6-N-acetylglucosamine synthase-like glycosyltransferase